MISDVLHQTFCQRSQQGWVGKNVSSHGIDVAGKPSLGLQSGYTTTYCIHIVGHVEASCISNSSVRIYHQIKPPDYCLCVITSGHLEVLTAGLFT